MFIFYESIYYIKNLYKMSILNMIHFVRTLVYSIVSNNQET